MDVEWTKISKKSGGLNLTSLDSGLTSSNSKLFSSNGHGIIRMDPLDVPAINTFMETLITSLVM